MIKREFLKIPRLLLFMIKRLSDNAYTVKWGMVLLIMVLIHKRRYLSVGLNHLAFGRIWPKVWAWVILGGKSREFKILILNFEELLLMRDLFLALAFKDISSLLKGVLKSFSISENCQRRDNIWPRKFSRFLQISISRS